MRRSKWLKWQIGAGSAVAIAFLFQTVRASPEFEQAHRQAVAAAAGANGAVAGATRTMRDDDDDFPRSGASQLERRQSARGFVGRDDDHDDDDDDDHDEEQEHTDRKRRNDRFRQPQGSYGGGTGQQTPPTSNGSSAQTPPSSNGGSSQLTPPQSNSGTTAPKAQTRTRRS